MTFKQLNEKIQEQFSTMVKTGKLFRVNVSGKTLWDIYLESFDEHPIWRVNSVHNCDNDPGHRWRHCHQGKRPLPTNRL